MSEIETTDTAATPGVIRETQAPEADTEGHKKFVRATEDDDAEADTEGHKKFVRATEDDDAEVDTEA